jgi:glutaryl-CoA dehydrogenase
LYAVDALVSEGERNLQREVRRWVDERIRPDVAGWFERGEAPVRELAQELGGRGWLGMHLTGFGCAGASAVEYGLVCHEMEAGDSGIRSLVSVQGSLAMHAIHTYGSEEQKQQWLPGMAAGRILAGFCLTEPGIGSDPANMHTTARRDGSDWILHGAKKWVTNGGVADVLVLWARADDGVRGFLVPTDAPGLSMAAIPGRLSLRAASTTELALSEVRLPTDAALPGARGLRAALSCLNEARFGIVFGAAGAARDCLESAIGYACGRRQFDRPIAGFQLTQQKLADMALDVGNGMLLALHLGRLKESGQLRPAQVSAGKLNNTRMALRVARTARAILGANGTTVEHPVMRHMNNLESVVTYEGTEEMHTLVVGEALTGLSAYR